ncbi:uncharacterized mitochondrial protein-like protein [Tanacetum coccineum]
MVKICDGCQAIKRKETTIHITHFFDIMKQYKMKVNDIRAERIAKSANPLALLAAAQPYSDNYYQAPKPQRSNATSSSTRPSASTRHKGKEIAKPVTPQSESVSEEDSDPEHAQRDKDMQKNLALLTKNKICELIPHQGYNNEIPVVRDLATMQRNAGSQKDTDEEIDERNWKNIKVLCNNSGAIDVSFETLQIAKGGNFSWVNVIVEVGKGWTTGKGCEVGKEWTVATGEQVGGSRKVGGDKTVERSKRIGQGSARIGPSQQSSKSSVNLHTNGLLSLIIGPFGSSTDLH